MILTVAIIKVQWKIIITHPWSSKTYLARVLPNVWVGYLAFICSAQNKGLDPLPYARFIQLLCSFFSLCMSKIGVKDVGRLTNVQGFYSGRYASQTLFSERRNLPGLTACHSWSRQA
jgi:hypothetical protein